MLYLFTRDVRSNKPVVWKGNTENNDSSVDKMHIAINKLILCIVEVILELIKYVYEQYSFVNSLGFESHRVFLMVRIAFHIC